MEKLKETTINKQENEMSERKDLDHSVWIYKGMMKHQDWRTGGGPEMLVKGENILKKTEEISIMSE